MIHNNKNHPHVPLIDKISCAICEQLICWWCGVRRYKGFYLICLDCYDNLEFLNILKYE